MRKALDGHSMEQDLSISTSPETSDLIAQLKTAMLILPPIGVYGYAGANETLLFSSDTATVKAYANMLSAFSPTIYDGGHTILIITQSMSKEEMNVIDELGRE